MSRASAAILVRGVVVGAVLMAFSSYEARAERAVIIVEGVEGKDAASHAPVIAGATAVLKNATWEVLSDTEDPDYKAVAGCVGGGPPRTDCIKDKLGFAQKDTLLYFRLLDGAGGASSVKIVLAVFQKGGGFKQENQECARCSTDKALNKATRELTAKATGLELPEMKLPTAPVMITTQPADADISIDGKPVGKSGQVFQIAEGRHLLTVSRDGYVAQQKTIEVNLKKNEPLEITLLRLGEGAVKDDEPLHFGVLKWVSLSSAVVLVGMGALAISVDGDPLFLEEPDEPPKRDKQRRTAPAGYWALGVSGALFAASGYMIWNDYYRTPETAEKAGLSLQISGDSIGIGYSGRY